MCLAVSAAGCGSSEKTKTAKPTTTVAGATTSLLTEEPATGQPTTTRAGGTTATTVRGATAAAPAGGLAAVKLAASKVSGTERNTTEGAPEDDESVSITITVKPVGDGRFRVDEVDQQGETREGKTVRVSGRGLEMVAADFETENDCAWDVPVVLVPTSAAPRERASARSPPRTSRSRSRSTGRSTASPTAPAG